MAIYISKWELVFSYQNEVLGVNGIKASVDFDSW